MDADLLGAGTWPEFNFHGSFTDDPCNSFGGFLYYRRLCTG
ncbi:Uncharacterised protein [Chlamydia trachomatis]|nr:Uncharacterised protein [Chlamydia trachomatis]